MTALHLPRTPEAIGADALYGATSVDELQDAWGLHCSDFADESPERERLLKLFRDRLEVMQLADRLGGYLRAG